MTTPDTHAWFKRRSRFALTIRFDLFFAMQAATDPLCRLHREWTAQIRARLPVRFEQAWVALGEAPHLWTLVPDALLAADPCDRFEHVRSALERLSDPELQRILVVGALHDDASTEALIAGEIDLGEAVRRSPTTKREWLAFIGLYPASQDAPTVRALSLLLRAPAEFRGHLLAAAEAFWIGGFADAWDRARDELERSRLAQERLFGSCTFREFARQALLRVEVDQARGVIKAIRGGAKVRFADVGSCEFSPSLFNEQRFWTSRAGAGGEELHFPYFDPTLTLGAGTRPDPSIARLDPALIFRALGDATRWAIVTLIAQRPASSAELAQRLAVSKPTISHHVYELREAGLLEEVPGARGSVQLGLRRAAIEGLSALTLSQLYASTEPASPDRLRTTRSKP
jgi:DNA-binding transcriptional ArsR family regulator